MKKTIMIMVLLTALIFTGCTEKVNAKEIVLEKEATASEVSVPAIEGEIEKPEEVVEVPVSPVDFDFIVDEEVNAEAIVNHAHELGLLENSWSEPEEIKTDDILNAYEREHKKEWAEPIVFDDTSIPSLQILERDIDNLIMTFVDLTVDTLHKAETYRPAIKTYEFYAKTAEEEKASEESAKKWSVQAGDVKELEEKVYEIALVDHTDKAAPVAFGTLTVENNEGVPKYISFVKAGAADGAGIEAGADGTGTGNGTQKPNLGTGTDGAGAGGTGTGGTGTGSTGGTGTGGTGTGGTGTGGTGTGGTGTGGTGGTGTGGTGTKKPETGTGTKKPATGGDDGWGGITFPGDPDVDTSKGDDLSDVDWK